MPSELRLGRSPEAGPEGEHADDQRGVDRGLDEQLRRRELTQHDIDVGAVEDPDDLLRDGDPDEGEIAERIEQHDQEDQAEQQHRHAVLLAHGAQLGIPAAGGGPADQRAAGLRREGREQREGEMPDRPDQQSDLEECQSRHARTP